MKFSNGYWMTREGYEVLSPYEIHDVRVSGNSITVFATHRHLEHRGNTLNEPLMTMEFSSPMKDIIRARFYHHKGRRRAAPDSFDLLANGNAPVVIDNNDEFVSLTSGDTTVKITKAHPVVITYTHKGRVLTGSGTRQTAFVRAQDGKHHFREQLNLAVGETVYGLGERFSAFVKNGQVVDIWNEDGGTASEQAYKNVPFYVTNRGYGVFVNHPELVSFEVASEKVSKNQFSVAGEQLEYYLIGGDSLKDVLGGYTSLTGKPALPPAWTFGLWLTTSFTTNYDEETVNSFIDGMAERDLPLAVFHFDCFWMKEYQWCDFEWDERVFPDPKGMLERLKAKGLKICVWINPYIAQRSPLFDEGMENGYLLKRPDGSVWQWDMWQYGMGIVDFTNPAACKWFGDKLRALVDMGVDSFKTDFGERIPTDVVYFDGSDPMQMHNYYTQLYNKVVFEVLEEKLGQGQAALFARSATAGGQQFPVHWGGDCEATFESMAESLRGGLSLGLSGFGFWSHDIGGFEQSATPDLYKRWVAFGLLSSHSRLHGSTSYRVPWLFDEEAVHVLRRFTKLKLSLMPYLFGQAVQSSRLGLPMMRAMLLEFPGDRTADYLDRQYMLGDSLLVAPIFNEQGQSAYYLPQGQWTHFLTGEKAQGGTWRDETYDYFGLPLFVKENSIIPVGATNDRPEYDYSEGVAFHVFELQDGASASVRLPDLQGADKLQASASRSGGTIAFEASDSTGWSVVLRGVSSVAGVTGGTFETSEQGVVVRPESGATKLSIQL
ncbi:alpha-xylosidase [Cohnella thailandensis]|uniref:alpha-D-xyloside xylohydrolase n=1 Tax=Cohnella thailandensis TaxID=557557 RepID=A0A841ST40_9BACL|nr:alpha-xylosidase [Cohnella thailandensis]MBB6635503.1 alpha-xylosidase [Cohnella thailandensis]MBP1974883.1 alpha-D-xyloside xylohydrolase [Cohnella thailandensis]